MRKEGIKRNKRKGENWIRKTEWKQVWTEKKIEIVWKERRKNENKTWRKKE